LNGAVLELNHNYRWRFFGEFGITKDVQQVTLEQLKEIVVLMLQCCDYSLETMAELVVLSSHVSMFSVRALILNAIREHLAKLDAVLPGGVKINLPTIEEPEDTKKIKLWQ